MICSNINLYRNGSISNEKWENGIPKDSEKVDSATAYYPLDWAEYVPPATDANIDAIS